MRRAEVYKNNLLAGIITESDRGEYTFAYIESYLADTTQSAISLLLPKRIENFKSNYLFPFFFNMLSEGVNKEVQCRTLKIDENDNFGLLLATANSDTIGAVTIKQI